MLRNYKQNQTRINKIRFIRVASSGSKHTHEKAYDSRLIFLVSKNDPNSGS